MTDKARELLERAVAETMSNEWPEELLEEIRAYLAEPEVKREALTIDEITVEWGKSHCGRLLPFANGVRFAEKHHGIGEE